VADPGGGRRGTCPSCQVGSKKNDGENFYIFIAFINVLFEYVRYADTPMEAYKSVYMFPNIECLLKIICIIPVTTATSERSFSSLKRI